MTRKEALEEIVGGMQCFETDRCINDAESKRVYDAIDIAIEVFKEVGVTLDD